MALDEVGKRYAERKYVGILEESAHAFAEQVAAIKREFASRGMIRSGGYINALSQAYVARLEGNAQARVDTLLEAYAKSGIPLTEEIIGDIQTEVRGLCEREKNNIAGRLRRDIKTTFSSSPPGGFEGAMLGEVERGVDRIVSRLVRDLHIKHDESILDMRRKAYAPNRPTKEKWDVFICHASEDKEDIALPLAKALIDAGLEVWYDDFVVKIGDSLLEEIDKGLARSRYGVVILSPNFFAKDWPKKELDGLVAKEIGGEKVILPVWHNIDFEGVKAYSPTLAGRVAAKSGDGIPAIVAKILQRCAAA